MMKNRNNMNEIVIYKSEDGKTSIDVRIEQETVWLTQLQMVQLFKQSKQNISLHIRNIFRERELHEKSVVKENLTTASDGKSYRVKHYNLDVIISVGYRVKSKMGTQFRIWATHVLRDHILMGYTLNEKRLLEQQQKHLRELEEAVTFIKEAKDRKELSSDEAVGLLTIITEYTRSWLLLHQYDEDRLPTHNLSTAILYELTYENAEKVIENLKKNLISKKEASNLFGIENKDSLKAILGNVNQSFGGKDLYPSIEEKAAHLLYFVIKDHPFTDGNKRIASLLFIWFLEKNNSLYDSKGKRKINDNALVALALLVAESNPKQKDLMVRLIINLTK